MIYFNYLIANEDSKYNKVNKVKESFIRGLSLHSFQFNSIFNSISSCKIEKKRSFFFGFSGLVYKLTLIYMISFIHKYI